MLELFSICTHVFKKFYQRGKRTIDVWDASKLQINGCSADLRVLKFQEIPDSKPYAYRELWLVTPLAAAPPKVLWEIMHKRWDIEENAFHQLKTYCHAKHYYCHRATEVIFLLTILAFNMRELYLYGHIHEFRKRKITLKSVTRIFCDQLLLEDFRKLLYYDSG